MSERKNHIYFCARTVPQKDRVLYYCTTDSEDDPAIEVSEHEHGTEFKYISSLDTVELRRRRAAVVAVREFKQQMVQEL